MIVAAAAAAHLLPIAPLLLLPFAIVFFVVVFPFWGVALVILGLILVILRGLSKVSGGALDGPADAVYKAFRWVLTFGGFVRLDKKKEADSGAGTPR